MKLLVFAPCEKLIVDEDGNSTLITIIQNINIEIAAGLEVPADVMTPSGWDVVTLWFPEEGDTGKTFHQRLEFEQPDGSIPIRGKLTFTITEKAHRNKMHINGFPVGRRGLCWLKLWLDCDGAEPSREPLATFPISVKHTPAGA